MYADGEAKIEMKSHMTSKCPWAARGVKGAVVRLCAGCKESSVTKSDAKAEKKQGCSLPYVVIHLLLHA